MLNLFDYLTPLDNKRIEKFLTLYAVDKKDYIGNERFLREWAKNKKRLFHLLGGNLIVKRELFIEKSRYQLGYEMLDILSKENLIRNLTKYLQLLGQTPLMPVFLPRDGKDIREELELLGYKLLFISPIECLDNKFGYKIKLPTNKIGRSLNIYYDTKLLRAVRKIYEYCDYFECFKYSKEQFLKDYKSFEKEYSKLLQNKVTKYNVCFSIHPLDFLTMSDNANKWSSCLSWKGNKARRIGTIEMMNSNNIICCYVESASTSFTIDENCPKEEENLWNSKKWRQLCVVTNEIILGGKAYPYQHSKITHFIIETLRELAKENLNRTYEYGIEEYQDMKHVGSPYRLALNKHWIKTGDCKKHNILFDTNCMYNDLMFDHNYKTIYWCCRNKVRKNIVINISGKLICLYCGRTFYNHKSPRDIEDEDFFKGHDDYGYKDYVYNRDCICLDCNRKRLKQEREKLEK